MKLFTTTGAGHGEDGDSYEYYVRRGVNSFAVKWGCEEVP